MISRNELKFIAFWPFNYEIPELIKLIPGQFSEIYKPRFINNIYFDSFNFNDYADTINGISNRKKIRLRWYGEFFGLINSPALEIKQKRGRVVKKIIHTFPHFEIKPSMNIKVNINNISSGNGFHYIKNREPNIINRYKRKYFLSNNKKFRITIDTNQQFTNPKNIQTPRKIYPVEPQPTIIELKFDVQWEKEVMRITNALPFRINKNSKYVNTLKALYPQLD